MCFWQFVSANYDNTFLVGKNVNKLRYSWTLTNHTQIDTFFNTVQIVFLLVLQHFNFVTDTGFDALGGVLQPVSAGQTTTTSANNINNNNNINNANNNTLNQQASPLLTGDLESSLASLAENLTINSRTAPIK